MSSAHFLLYFKVISTLINFLNNIYSFFIHLGIANVDWVFNISYKYFFGVF